MAGEILDNREAIEAWDGPLFDRFVQFRHLLVEGLAGFGERAIELHAPRRGDRVLDIGCGFGDSAPLLARAVGPDGSVLGVDAAPRFVDCAQAEFGTDTIRFAVADVERTTFDQEFDFAFSRFGTMFFANPVHALRNVRAALCPGGRLCMVVWRRKLDNDWMHRPEVLVADHLTRPDEYDEPTCGPGPFSMANADTLTDILLTAGYRDISLTRCDRPIRVGADLDEAIALTTALGPAGEVIRLLGDRADDAALAQVDATLRTGLRDFVQPDGSVAGPASTWIVAAANPSNGTKGRGGPSGFRIAKVRGPRSAPAHPVSRRVAPEVDREVRLSLLCSGVTRSSCGSAPAAPRARPDRCRPRRSCPSRGSSCAAAQGGPGTSGTARCALRSALDRGR